MTSPEPITAQPVTPLSKEAWEAQYQLGAFLTGPFDEADPQLPLRVAADYGEPASAENVAAWLHDNATCCANCRRFWLADDEDAPNDNASEDLLCEACAEDVEPADNHSTYWAYRGSVVG